MNNEALADYDSIEETLRLARVDAYVEFSSAAWSALEIRRIHGIKSPEYVAARACTDAARTVFATAADTYRAHTTAPSA